MSATKEHEAVMMDLDDLRCVEETKKEELTSALLASL
jgi:hypothetical protein